MPFCVMHVGLFALLGAWLLDASFSSALLHGRACASRAAPCASLPLFVCVSPRGKTFLAFAASSQRELRWM
jgi:hypothetical protein